MDPNLFYGRIAEIAPEWNPFPMLEQLDQLQANPQLAAALAQQTMQPSGYGWANPQAVAPGQIPQAQQPPGVQLLTGSPAAGQGPRGAAPFSPQQAATLGAMQKNLGQGQPRPPTAGIPGRPGQVQVAPIAPLPVPQDRGRMSLAQILGGGR